MLTNSLVQEVHMAKLLTDELLITADQLKTRLHGGKVPFMVNLRHEADWDVGILKARGALRIANDKLEEHLEAIPHDREVVIAYEGPGDKASRDAAHLLQRKGWRDVFSLKGGFAAYLDAGLPVEDLKGRSVARKRMLLSGS